MSKNADVSKTSVDSVKFVNTLYTSLLKRAASEEEIRAHSLALDNGDLDPSDLVSIFVNSEEFQKISGHGVTPSIERTLLAQNALNERRYNIDVQNLYEARKRAHPNTLVRYGNKAFSQSDEDGITFEICRRLQIDAGTFLEFGVSDGTENNTLALLANGWRGEWFGGQDLAFSADASDRLDFSKVWVTRDNIVTLVEGALKRLGQKAVDIISLDLDGNDYFLISKILEAGLGPKLFVAEYNGKLIPPIRFSIDYDAAHTWNSDDYYGVSLSLLDDLFAKHGYKLICCNAATGANAFFVKNEYADLFPEVPADIRDIFVPLNFNLYNYFGHNASIRTILKCLK